MKSTGPSKIIAVIHARGGSVRVPLKNIKLLDGKPLIAYTIEAALNSKHLDRVIVSTDHPDIKRISLEYGAEVPFDRPKELAEDVPSEWVTQHAARFLEQEQNKLLDLIVTIQPTTPFCLGSDIDAAIALVKDNPAFDSSMSVRDISERPEWMYLKEGNAITNYAKIKIQGDVGVSQTLPKLYYPNGAVYVTRRKTLFEDGVIISSERCAGHVMSRERSVDIDEPVDFLYAEFVAQELKKRGEI